MQKKIIHPKVLVAPLDWGLGHATRCIALIRLLLEMGCDVTIASSGSQLVLLRKEFPGLNSIELPGYNVRYTRIKRLFALRIIMQTPKILLSIYREHKWLQSMLQHTRIDIVISDNRYGLYSKKTYCVFMTHQLHIQAPYRWLEKSLQKINYNLIGRFAECWVPDMPGSPNMGGRLSHPDRLPPVPVTYVGNLSRFTYGGDTPSKTYEYVFLISGPEPQRSVFEAKILQLLDKLPGPVLVFRGKPGENNNPAAPPHCRVINHADTKQLAEILPASRYIISRCGYTTVMEVLSLGVKSILVPTPGQTEQEYLASHLKAQHWCYSCSQDDDLMAHIARARDFDYKMPAMTRGTLDLAISALLNGNGKDQDLSFG